MPQAPTRRVKVTHIMARAEFWIGAHDKRAGKGFCRDYDLTWDKCRQYYYEKGRLWATIAPPTMPLRAGRSINPAAVRVYAEGRRAGAF